MSVFKNTAVLQTQFAEDVRTVRCCSTKTVIQFGENMIFSLRFKWCPLISLFNDEIYKKTTGMHDDAHESLPPEADAFL